MDQKRSIVYTDFHPRVSDHVTSLNSQISQEYLDKQTD